MLDLIISIVVRLLFWCAVIIGSVLIGALLFPSCASAYTLLDVSHLDLEYRRFDPDTRDPYAPQYTGYWREQAAVLLDLRLLRWGYWNNRIHMETTDPSGRATGTGWQWEAGLKLGPVDVFQFHHSRHLLDEPGTGEPHMFPVENAVGIRIRLLGDK